MKFYLEILVGIFILFGTSLKTKAQELDRFAEIGNKPSAIRTHLLEFPQPPTLDSIFLDFHKGDKYAFKPIDKLDTQEELVKELEKMRSSYSSYMKNYAPTIEQKRNILKLSNFKWKTESEVDKANFGDLLIGNSEWEEVEIPHYGEPVGEATTYYYKEFELDEAMLNKEALFILFNGVDYIAQVFMNGYYLGSHEGFFAPFEFNFTEVAKKGINKLLVKVINHNVGAKGEKIYAATGPGYDEPLLGWHHCPAGMGIYQDVFVEARSQIHINDVFVRPLLEAESAEVWLEINNTKAQQKNIKISYSVFGQNFKDTICQNIVYSPSTVVVPGVGDLAKSSDGRHVKLPLGLGSNFYKFSFKIHAPKIWNNQTPWLYQLQVKVLSDNGETLDIQKQQFGMRSFTMDTTSIPKGKLFLNNNSVRLRGANTMGHLQGCVMRKDWDQLRDDILLAKICNMNYIRLTQRPVQQEIYDYCDMLGMMTQTDLPLFGALRRTKFSEAIKQAEEMERLIRSHPCNIMVSYINERFPNAEGHPQRSFSNYADYEKFYTAANQAVLIANPDRVIKPGDGDYDPPSPGLPDNHCYNLWYNGHGLGVGEMHKGFWQPVKPGWFYACGEYGAEGLDPVNTMEKYYPENWCKESSDGIWKPNNINKCQTSAFHVMWYDDQITKKNWVNSSQQHQALAAKLTTEAFRRDSRMVSSAIHLFIDAWPGGWMKSIMDVDRQAKKAYFAYKDALSPIIISLRSDRNKFFPDENINIEIWICNDKIEIPENVILKYQIEEGKRIIYSGEINSKIPICSSKFQGFLKWFTPRVTKRTSYALRASLVDKNNNVIHENNYDFEVFPRSKPVQKTSYIIGNKNGISDKIADAVGLKIVDNYEDASILLMDGKFFNNSDSIIDYVADGKRLIVFELPVGEYSLQNSNFEVIPTLMGDYYFISTNTGHPLIKGFKEDDFKFWYDSKKEIISPILNSMITANDWNMVLKTGIGKRKNNLGTVDFNHAVMEKKFGNGSVIISQVNFNNKLEGNPVAIEFLIRILK